MSRYIKSFFLPHLDKRNSYPYNVLAPKRLRNIEFDPITIFYGSNGSGKSTLLNIMARKLNLDMNDRGNDAQYIQPIIDGCIYQKAYDEPIAYDTECPEGSRFIRSEEVMHTIVKLRKENQVIKEHLQANRPDLFKKFFVDGPNNGFNVWNEDRWILGVLDRFNNSKSNGELAFNYFQDMISFNSLILLDEPENSMSPKFQKEFAKMIEDYAHYFKCQFIIATHSPFLLAIPDAKIYNIDHTPTDVCKVQDLESIKLYEELMDSL